MKKFIYIYIFMCIHLYADSHIDILVEDFMKKSSTIGMSVAIAKHGKIVFSKGYGYADREFKEKVHPYYQFRVASLTKPMTAVAIMKLIQEGRLKLHDKVFGDKNHHGLLKFDYRKNGKILNNPTLFDIEVLHLLEHTSGNWYNQRKSILTNARYKGMKFVHYVLAGDRTNRVIYHPGDKYKYSNFGYYILGLIIEKVTGMTYEDYMRDVVLKDFPSIDFYPKGRLANNKEVRYYSEYKRKPYKDSVVAKIFSAGGAVASAEDLARFGSSLDTGNINHLGLTSKSIKLLRTSQTMGGKKARYAKGLCVPFRGRWWHSGRIPSTRSMLLCEDANGKKVKDMCIAIIINTEIKPKYAKEFKALAQKIGQAFARD